MVHRAEFEQWLPRSLEEVFLFFANPANMPWIMPPWMRVALLEVNVIAPLGTQPATASVSWQPSLAGAGSELFASYRVVPFLPFRMTSGARITAFVMNQYFEDIQTRGPFKSWHHRHEFRPEARNGRMGTLVRDVIEYDAGFGILGAVGRKLFIAPQLQSTFRYRQRALEKLMGTNSVRP